MERLCRRCELRFLFFFFYISYFFQLTFKKNVDLKSLTTILENMGPRRLKQPQTAVCIVQVSFLLLALKSLTTRFFKNMGPRRLELLTTDDLSSPAYCFVARAV